MALALFVVVYACATGTGICIESHFRLSNKLQAASIEQCNVAFQKFPPIENASEMHSYCQYEKEGPNYRLIFNSDNNTTNYELSH